MVKNDSLFLVPSVGKVFNVCFATSSEVSDVAANNPNRVSRTTGQHRQVLEFRVHHHTLLRASDIGLDAIDVKCLRDVGVRHLDSSAEAAAIAQVVGEASGPPDTKL